MKRLLKIVLIIAGGTVLGIVALLVLSLYAPPPTPTASETIASAEYGDRWPLTVESGRVECRGWASVVFHTGGKTYAVNGLALSLTDYPDIREIWRDDPDDAYGQGLKIDISPILDRGLALCP